MNNANSQTIIILCSDLCRGENVCPFSAREWSDIALNLTKHSRIPSDILSFGDSDFVRVLEFDDSQIARIKRLIARSCSITFELAKLKDRGIDILTRADSEYPTAIKRKLGALSPPLFYFVGDISLLSGDMSNVACDGSATESDTAMARDIADKAIARGRTIAFGDNSPSINNAIIDEIISHNGVAVELGSGVIVDKIKSGANIRLVRNKHMLILSLRYDSVTKSSRVISQCLSALARETIIIKANTKGSDLLSTAKSEIDNSESKVYCWNNPTYRGNQELINCGAIPIDSGNISGGLGDDIGNILNNGQRSMFD